MMRLVNRGDGGGFLRGAGTGIVDWTWFWVGR